MIKGQVSMRKEVVILVAEDDEGHAGLIRKNLLRDGIVNEMLHFKNGMKGYVLEKKFLPK